PDGKTSQLRIPRLPGKRAGGSQSSQRQSTRMIIVLGASGYMGQSFAEALRAQGMPFKALSRKEVDYTRYAALVKFLRDNKPDFLINAAGYTGKPNVDACEIAKADTLAGNTL